jgi:hypothetical protein
MVKKNEKQYASFSSIFIQFSEVLSSFMRNWRVEWKNVLIFIFIFYFYHFFFGLQETNSLLLLKTLFIVLTFDFWTVCLIALCVACV